MPVSAVATATKAVAQTDTPTQVAPVADCEIGGRRTCVATNESTARIQRQTQATKVLVQPTTAILTKQPLVLLATVLVLSAVSLTAKAFGLILFTTQHVGHGLFEAALDATATVLATLSALKVRLKTLSATQTQAATQTRGFFKPLITGSQMMLPPIFQSVGVVPSLVPVFLRGTVLSATQGLAPTSTRRALVVRAVSQAAISTTTKATSKRLGAATTTVTVLATRRAGGKTLSVTQPSTAELTKFATMAVLAATQDVTALATKRFESVFSSILQELATLDVQKAENLQVLTADLACVVTSEHEARINLEAQLPVLVTPIRDVSATLRASVAPVATARRSVGDTLRTAVILIGTTTRRALSFRISSAATSSSFEWFRARGALRTAITTAIAVVVREFTPTHKPKPAFKIISFKEVGPANTPQEIKRLRRQNMDLSRRMGQPVIMRHMWNRDDVAAGVARECPACYSSVYDQVRNDCEVCFGTGFASVEEEPSQLRYINTAGEIVIGNPGTYIRAPRWGGFDEPVLTWLLEPDVAVDVFRINEQGLMVRTYDGQGVGPWFPDMGDNDLCMNVVLDKNGFSIIESTDRFQLKMVQQVTVRGFGKLARYGAGNQTYLVAQSFKMAKIPSNNILYRVPVPTIEEEAAL